MKKLCLRPSVTSLLVLLTTLIFAFNYANCIAQSETDYCGMNTNISMTHLHINQNGNFTLWEYFKVHGELWESTEIGQYVVKGDTVFLSSHRYISKDSVVEYKPPLNYLGYYEGQIFYFGKGPYIPLKKCSMKRVQHLKKKLQL
jgi:hypothetical protein